MKELFERHSPKINIGVIGNKDNETIEEKIARLEESKTKLSVALINPKLKEELLSMIDETIAGYESHNHRR